MRGAQGRRWLSRQGCCVTVASAGPFVGWESCQGHVVLVLDGIGSLDHFLRKVLHSVVWRFRGGLEDAAHHAGRGSEEGISPCFLSRRAFHFLPFPARLELSRQDGIRLFQLHYLVLEVYDLVALLSASGGAVSLVDLGCVVTRELGWGVRW